jgi:hypothetical protein
VPRDDEKVPLAPTNALGRGFSFSAQWETGHLCATLRGMINIILLVVFGVLVLTVVMVTRRVFDHNLTSHDAPPLSDLLTNGTSFAPSSSEEDGGRVRHVSSPKLSSTAAPYLDSERSRS